MAVVEYATIFSNVLRELYAQDSKSYDLFQSNLDLQLFNGKYIKVPTLSVSGYKDHTRGSSFNAGSFTQNYETKSLDHDRDIEFIVDPMDVDESNLTASVANIQKRFDTTQAIPELDAYTFSKIYTEFVRVGGTVSTTALTAANVLSTLDADMQAMEDAGVPLDRVILYCTSAVKKLIKESSEVTRMLSAADGNGIDRRFKTIDDIQKIVTVPSSRFKTAFNFSNGFTPATTAKQINYILIDPEAQVSRNKYSYIKVFTPGHDSRTADNYLYQNRRYNGTFAIDELMGTGCKINADA
jgi:hypothetical protein